MVGAFVIIGQRPTFPPTCAGSIIGAEGLNFRVRDGNGCFPLAMVTQSLKSLWMLNIDGRPREATERILCKG